MSKLNHVKLRNNILTANNFSDEVNVSTLKAQHLIASMHTANKSEMEELAIQDGLLSAIDMVMSGDLDMQAKLLDAVLGIKVELSKVEEDDSYVMVKYL